MTLSQCRPSIKLRNPGRRHGSLWLCENQELGDVLGQDIELEVMHSLPPVVTEPKAFTSIGAKWYGFAPVKLPPTLRFADMFHGHDERIPVEGLAWGTQTLMEVVRRCIGT